MKYFSLFIVAVFLFSCNGNDETNRNDSTQAAAQKQKDSAAFTKPARDSFLVNTDQSSFNVTRSKTVKDVNKEVRIGKSVMHMKMDNASFTASTKINIAGAYWETNNNTFTGGIVVLDMKSVTALQIGEDEKISAGNPGYLETEKYPTAMLQIVRFDPIPGNSKEMLVKSYLTIKHQTEEVLFPAKIEFENSAHPDIPSKFTGSFHIDGVKWGLNPKNSKVIKDDLKFDVVLLAMK